jgi:uncharacterized protein (TIGR02246 family)
MTTSAEPGLQELQDRAEIHDVMMRYATALDTLDWDGVAACFTKDAHSVYSGNDLGHGVDKILAYIQGLANMKVTTHFMGNQLIEVKGDTASMATYCVAYLAREREGRDVIVIRGLRYIDQLLRQDRRWLINDRVHTCDWMREDAVVIPVEANNRSATRPS